VRGLTEDELLDKINRDIAVWKSEYGDVDNYDDDLFDEDDEDEYFDDEDDDFEMFDESSNDNKDSKENKFISEISFQKQREVRNEFKAPMKKGWSIPRERKEGAEIVEEDRQYLEEIVY